MVGCVGMQPGNLHISKGNHWVLLHCLQDGQQVEIPLSFTWWRESYDVLNPGERFQRFDVNDGVEVIVRGIIVGGVIAGGVIDVEGSSREVVTEILCKSESLLWLQWSGPFLSIRIGKFSGRLICQRRRLLFC